MDIINLALSSLVGVAPSTKVSYAYAVLRMCRFLWAIGANPETLTRHQYRAYRRWLDECSQLPDTQKAPTRHDPARLVDITGHISRSTVSQSEAAARSLYRALEENEYIEASPVPVAAASNLSKGNSPLDALTGFRRGQERAGEAQPIAKKKRKRTQPVPPELQEVLLADPTPRGRAMWRFMLESGPRINEVLTMQPQRMLLSDNTVDVLGKGLGGETRTVPISDAAVEAFEEYRDDLAGRGIHLERGTSVWRSLRRPHHPIAYEAIRDAMHQRLAAHTRKRFTPHALRHTAATTMLLDLGLPVEQVQQILGHAFLASTQVYLHADQSVVTQDFTRAWRTGRVRPVLDVSDLYSTNLISAFLEALDD